MKKILKSYFYWTYPRGSFHYDVLVTLILVFLFVTPQLWNYGDKPAQTAGPRHPIEVVGIGARGLLITVGNGDKRRWQFCLEGLGAPLTPVCTHPRTGFARPTRR